MAGVGQETLLKFAKRRRRERDAGGARVTAPVNAASRCRGYRTAT